MQIPKYDDHLPFAKEVNGAIATLLTHYMTYASREDVEAFEDTLQYAMDAHRNQHRANGEPYIIHPLAVADILTELEADGATLMAAMLHDTVEDTESTTSELSERFGQDVADLVDGVTKLEKMQYSSKEELQAENFRKMFLAMAKDIRVVWIKLADRLHNMRTLKHLSPEKQERIAQETLDIYAPLANRLGIYKWKWELEDLCLRYIDRTAYYELVGAISQRRNERENYLEQVILELTEAIEKLGIKSEIEGRPKHFYSIYRKMKLKDKNLDQIYDLFACRIIVDTVSDCYAVLGLVHEKYRPIPGRFKDYIAMPKPNMYQSLHTTVIGPQGIPFEVQIRTLAMHRTAEFGLAAHWKYKEGISSGSDAEDQSQDNLDSKLNWLRQLLDWQKDMRDATEFMHTLKTGLVSEEVYVFTPRGDVLSLPAKSVPIDFAYAVHSGVGNHMYGAKVNGKIVPLTYQLQNGDIVEILTSEKIHGPSMDWLKIVASSGARSKINQFFKKSMRAENIARGKELLEREIKKSDFTMQQLLKNKIVEPVLQRYNYGSIDDLYAGLGHGAQTPGKIVPKLRDEYIKSISEDERTRLGYRLTSSGQVVYSPPTVQLVSETEIQPTPAAKKSKSTKVAKNEYGIIVRGIDNCLIRLSRCCNPVSGDAIIGYISRGKGVAIHRRDCPNIRHILESSSNGAAEAERASRLIEVSWDNEETGASFEVSLKILAHDRHHLLSDLSNAIAEEKVSILSGQINSFKDVTARMLLTVEVSSQNQLDRVIGRLKAVRDVIEVERV